MDKKMREIGGGGGWGSGMLKLNVNLEKDDT